MLHNVAAKSVKCAHSQFFQMVWECGILLGETLDREETTVFYREAPFHALAPLSRTGVPVANNIR